MRNPTPAGEQLSPVQNHILGDQCSPPLLFGLVPRVENYAYPGFPVTGAGIDFTKHLTKRLDQACGRADFLSLHSDRWGPAHRLRIYRQYLAPIFEHGAPLVAACAERCWQFWEGTENAVKRLTGWISGYGSNTHLTRNLLGLQSLSGRFAGLKTLFQVVIRHRPDSSPSMVLRGLDWEPDSFFRCFTEDQTFQNFMQSGRDVPNSSRESQAVGATTSSRTARRCPLP